MDKDKIETAEEASEKKYPYNLLMWTNHAVNQFRKAFVLGAKWKEQQPLPEQKNEWIDEKPEFKENCILLTAFKIKDQWEYNSWLIEKQHSDEGWYWGWLTINGEEYGDINDLKADLYKIISAPPKQL